MPRDPVTQAGLERLSRPWQRRLRLHDWRIVVRWADLAELTAFFAEDSDDPLPERSARQAMAATDDLSPHAVNTTAAERREATILLKRGAYEDARQVKAAVIHELVHIVLGFLTPAPNDRVGAILLERAVISLEEAFMEGEP